MSKTNVPPRHLIAIVGSRGGLKPLVTIVRDLPLDLDAAVVVLIHRGATTKSHLAEILSRATSLPVAFAVDGERLERGRIYVVPPGDRHALIQGRTIRLVAAPRVHYHRPAGDPLLYSAAAAFGPDAIGVILSGMGRNGEAGVAAIKQGRGKVFVQSVVEAEYPSMPRHAMAAAEPDACLMAAEIAPRLAALCAPAVVPFEAADRAERPRRREHRSA
ncbi:MAG TPA: chemotaxis protein CheB [Polyangia bacterium]|nr:chemotaxis protein CheB [Polyangia bacterium]